jgi:hypothetical protein
LWLRIIYWYLNFELLITFDRAAHLAVFIAPVVIYGTTIGFDASMTPTVLIFTHSVAGIIGWAVGWL